MTARGPWPRVVLGSRSPRRRELLTGAVGEQAVIVCPPHSAEELGFDGLPDDESIRARLMEIVDAKLRDVQRQRAAAVVDTTLDAQAAEWIVVADTTVVVSDDQGKRSVLGQPPAADWQATVRRWFSQHLSGRTHDVLTGVIVARDEMVDRFIVTTHVAFDVIDEAAIDRYLATAESVGKAGGYAIQGHAAAFVRSVDGSLSNVIGLPIQEVMASLRRLGWP